jgi:hypothetical protein
MSIIYAVDKRCYGSEFTRALLDLSVQRLIASNFLSQPVHLTFRVAWSFEARSIASVI